MFTSLVTSLDWKCKILDFVWQWLKIVSTASDINCLSSIRFCHLARFHEHLESWQNRSLVLNSEGC